MVEENKIFYKKVPNICFREKPRFWDIQRSYLLTNDLHMNCPVKLINQCFTKIAIIIYLFKLHKWKFIVEKMVYIWVINNRNIIKHFIPYTMNVTISSCWNLPKIRNLKLNKTVFLMLQNRSQQKLYCVLGNEFFQVLAYFSAFLFAAAGKR